MSTRSDAAHQSSDRSTHLWHCLRLTSKEVLRMNVWMGFVIALALALVISVWLREARELLAEDERILAEESTTS